MGNFLSGVDARLISIRDYKVVDHFFSIAWPDGAVFLFFGESHDAR